MNTLRSTPRSTPALLAIGYTALVSGTSGSLGGPLIGIIGAVAGALWGAGLVLLADRLSRSETRHHRWANATLFGTVLCTGLVTGAGFLGQLLFSATLDDRPQVFGELIRGPVGDAEALPFFLFNSPLDYLLIPAALLLVWSNPRRRKLILAALALWTFHRTWTYLHFVPIIGDLSEAAPGTPLTTDQLDQARSWTDLSWIRSLIDIIATVLALLAAFTPAANHTRQHAK